MFKESVAPIQVIPSLEYIIEFVDIDGVCEDVISNDGYGNILNGYDGQDDEYKVNGKWYHVMRHN